jgi:transcriptional regulator NrdR family protein
MNCPTCGKTSKVYTTKQTSDGPRRFHRCNHCGTYCVSLNYVLVSTGKNIGENHYKSKLTESLVRELRAYAATGVSSFEVGAAFDIDQKHAWKIINRKSWAHVS